MKIYKNGSTPPQKSRNDQAKDEVQKYFNDALDPQDRQVATDIQKDVSTLFSKYDPDVQYDLVQQKLDELRKYISQVSQNPYTALERFPIHQKRKHFNQLLIDKKLVEIEQAIRDILVNEKWQWCYPMLQKWLGISLTAWQTSLDQLEFSEYSTISFMSCLYQYFTSYGKNKNGATAFKLIVTYSDQERQQAASDESTISEFMRIATSDVEQSKNLNIGSSDFSEITQNLSKQLERLPPESIRNQYIIQINRMLKMYQTEVSYLIENQVLTISKPVIVLSDIVNIMEQSLSQIHTITLCATSVVYLDVNLEKDKFHGKNICIMSTKVTIIGGITIDVSGNDNTAKPKEASPSSKNSDGSGKDGEDGDSGLPGESGGNVFIQCLEMINKDHLTIKSNGGNGSDGGDGSNGGDGDNGVDGGGEVIRKQNISSEISSLEVSKGTKGKSEGRCGNGGIGGEGGYGGEIIVITAEGKVSAHTESAPGEHGKTGKGGKGGIPGLDGVDTGYYCNKGFAASIPADPVEYGYYLEYKGKLSIEPGKPNNAKHTLVDNKDNQTWSLCQLQDEGKDERELRQQQQKQLNHGQAGKSSKHFTSAIKQTSINQDAMKQAFAQQVIVYQNGKSLFVHQKSSNFYQQMTNNQVKSDLEVDGVYLHRVGNLGQTINQLNEEVNKTIQVNTKEQHEFEREANYTKSMSTSIPEQDYIEDDSEEDPDEMTFNQFRQYLIVLLCDEKSIPTRYIKLLVSKIEEVFKNDNSFYELANPKLYADLIIDLVKFELGIDELKLGKQSASILDSWFREMKKTGIIIKQTNLFEWIEQNLIPYLTSQLQIYYPGKKFNFKVSATNNNQNKIILVYGLIRYLQGVKEHERDSFLHIDKIFKLLNRVEIDQDDYEILCATEVAKWILILEDIQLRERLEALCQNSSEDQITIKQIIMKLGKLESQFGAEYRKQFQDKLLNDCKINSIVLKDVIAVLDEINNGTIAADAGVFEIPAVYDSWSWLEVLKSKSTQSKQKNNQARSLDQLLDLIKNDPKNKSLEGIDFEKLKQTIEKIKSCENFKEYNEEKITKFLNDHKKEITQTLDGSNILGNEFLIKILALINRGIQLVNPNYTPRDTQLIAVLLSISQNKNFLEVATGEGKTNIVLILAILKALSGKKVDIVTSSSVLAKRDALDKQHIDIYDLFGFSVAYNCDGDDKVLEKCYKKNIVYGDVGSFQRDILVDKFYGKNIRARTYDAVIVDEVDSMVLDRGDHMLYLSQIIPGTEHLEVLYLYIWLSVNGNNLSGSKDDIKNIKEFIHQQELSGEIGYPNYFKEFVETRLDIWIESAFIAKNSLDRDDGYKLGESDRGVITMDKDTGVQMKNSHLSEGIHQFLQLKHLQRFKPETLKAIFMLNTAFFKQYNDLYGLSGTLGSDVEQSLLSDVYDVKTTYLPTFKPKRYTQDQDTIARVEKELLEQIVCKLDGLKPKNTTKRRPCLIITPSNAKAQELYESLKAKYPQVKLYKDDDKSLETDKLEWDDIIVSTNLAGRGTDLKISEEISEAGGLHVIMTYCPNNLRIERQGFGRSARNGQRGSGQFIIHESQHSNKNIEELIHARNKNEKQRLAYLKEVKLFEVKLEEVLLDQFKEKIFDKLDDRVNKLFENSNISKEIKEIYRKDVLEQFAFWLDQNKYNLILAAKEIGDYVYINKQDLAIVLKYDYNNFKKKHPKLLLISNFECFIEELRIEKLNFIEELGIRKLNDKKINLDNSVNTLLLAKLFHKNENYNQAIKYFNLVIKKEPEFCEIAEYYKAATLIKLKEASSNIKYQQKAIAGLRRAEVVINKRITQLSNLPQVVSSIKEIQRNQGGAIGGDLYQKYIEDKMQIYNSLLSNIRNICGNREFDFSQLTSLSLTEEQKKAVRKALKTNEELFQPKGIIEEFNFDKNKLEKHLKLPEYSDSIKQKIIDQLTQDRVLKKDLIKGMLGNVDDLFEQLEKANIIQVHNQSSTQNGEEKVYEFTQVESLDEKKNQESMITKIEELFNENEFKEKYPNAESLKEWLLEQAKLPRGDIQVITKKQINLLGKKEAFKKLKANLISQGVIHSQYLQNLTIKRDSVGSKIVGVFTDVLEEASNVVKATPKAAAETVVTVLEVAGGVMPGTLPLVERSAPQDSKLLIKVKEIVSATLKGIIGNDIHQKVTDDMARTIDSAIQNIEGDLLKKIENELSDGPVKLSLKPLKEVLGDNLDYEIQAEIEALSAVGIDCIIVVENKAYWWSTWVVILIGVSQIVAGAVICALGAPNIGAAFIGEGVGDIMYGIEAAITGNFSWHDYLKNKAISLAMSVITLGVGAVLSRGIKVAEAGIKTVIFKVLQETTEAVVTTLVNYGVDGIVDRAVEGIIKVAETSIDGLIKSRLEGIKKDLIDLSRKSQDKVAINNLMDKLDKTYLDQAQLDQKISQYFNQVVNAVVEGIVNAAHLRHEHSTAFATMQMVVDAIRNSFKIFNIASSIRKSIKEIDQFIMNAETIIQQEKNNLVIKSDVSTNESVKSEQEKEIDEKIKKWSAQIRGSAVQYLQTEVTKAAQHQVNKTLKQHASRLGEHMEQSHPQLFKKFRDETHAKSLQEAQEHNFTKLTLKDPHFGIKEKSMDDIIKNNPHLEPVHGASLSHYQKVSNADGHTVGDIRQWENVGHVFLKNSKNGDILVVPPATYYQPRNLEVAKLSINQRQRFGLADGDIDVIKINSHSDMEHAVATIYIGGKERKIDIPAISGKYFCVEQSMLFHDKLERVKAKYLGETEEQHIARAIAYAQKEHKIQKLRSLIFVECHRMIRADKDLQRKVAACDISVGGDESKRMIKNMLGKKRFEKYAKNKDGTFAMNKDNLTKLQQKEPEIFNEVMDKCLGIKGLHGEVRKYAIKKFIESDHLIPHSVLKHFVDLQGGKRSGENLMPAIAILYDLHRTIETTGSSEASTKFRDEMVEHFKKGNGHEAVKMAAEAYFKAGITDDKYLNGINEVIDWLHTTENKKNPSEKLLKLTAEELTDFKNDIKEMRDKAVAAQSNQQILSTPPAPQAAPQPTGGQKRAYPSPTTGIPPHQYNLRPRHGTI